jgi:hypothetical protein
LDLGANPNDKPTGGSSALDSCFWRLSFGPFDPFGTKRLRSRYDVHQALDGMGELVTRGAIWCPDRERMNGLRRTLYGCEPGVVVDVLQLFTKHNACSRETIQELLRTPAMKQHLATHTWHLKRLGLTLDDRRTKGPEAPPAELLATLQSRGTLR